MQNHVRTRLSRLFPLRRPLRPAKSRNDRVRYFEPRPFTSSGILTSIARPSARSQLGFLSGSSNVPKRSPFQVAASRVLSTEQRAYIKYKIRMVIYWILVFHIVGFGIWGSFQLFRQDWLDRLYPSPNEWSLFCRYRWRTVKHEELDLGRSRGMVQWSMVGTWMRSLISNLEQSAFNGRWADHELKYQEDYDASIPGIDPLEIHTRPENLNGEKAWDNRIGFDITAKSVEWRRGYWEAMMTLCKAAEMRDGYMTHPKIGTAYPPQYIRSEENPYPKPLPPQIPFPIADESECFRTIEKPSFHYIRLLTTKGFTAEQRMHAGVAYANWLDLCGQTDLAEQMYRWSLNRALEGISRPDSFVDRKTGVIRPSAPYVTPNIITVTTALASHHARLDNISPALNIYLSVLRARKASPPASRERQYPTPKPDLSLTNFDSIVRWIRSLPRPPKFPPPPRSGDEPFERAASNECEEAALVAYVGEILFARGNRRSEGLAWTRDATEVAEEMSHDSLLEHSAKQVCNQCLHTGLQNWSSMTKQLAREKEAKIGVEKRVIKKVDGGVSLGDEEGTGLVTFRPDQNLLAGRSKEMTLADAKELTKRAAFSTAGTEIIEPPIEGGVNGPANRGIFGSITHSLHRLVSPSFKRDEDFVTQNDWNREAWLAEQRLSEFETQEVNKKLSALISGHSSWFVA
ncbi:MAG: hypothetical protein M1831_004511 [Alyxoria varia]|nr:MAG: hypothetical protein M1831_004511 [Alyxoria varia]